MKRLIAVFALVFAALSLAAVAGADPGDHGKRGDDHGKHHEHFDRGKHRHGNGPFVFRTTVTTPDNGTCQNAWANDTLNRTYVVKTRADGSALLIVLDRGTFTTLAGQSPGACETTDSNHGHVVTAGIAGKIRGFIAGIVTGGTFNPNATCAANCTRDVFLTSFFGAGAAFSCNTDNTCRFDFKYRSNDSTLMFDHWRDRGSAANGALHERLTGDIATS